MSELKLIVCERCGSDDVLPLMYGLPGPEMEKMYDQGMIGLGGCVISYPLTNAECNQCGLRFVADESESFKERPSAKA